MDITSFVTSSRDRALLIGDYNTYRAQLSRQLLTLRKRLGRTTPKNSKYAAKAPVTAEDVAKNQEFVRLLLIQAERAWAQAMHMKSTHAEDSTSHGIVGPTRRHIISRLHKAYGHAKTLVAILDDRTTSGATDVDFLEAQAYCQCLAGAEEFEKQSSGGHEDPKAAWKDCVTHFSEAHIIYTALLYSSQKDVYKEILAGTVDPSIRYAAYQSRLSRTIPISTVARQHFHHGESELKSLVVKLNPTAFEDEKAQADDSQSGTTRAMAVPTTINWRGRTAPIADAAIGQAMAAATLASAQLSALLSSNSSTSAKALAAAYDPVLISAQDTVDAIRRSLSDLLKESIPESDPRTQELRVSDLAANHALISWRIGRNRVLISTFGTRDDGADFAPELSIRRIAKKKKRVSTEAASKTAQKSSEPPPQRHESKAHALARLTDRVVLYDATLQSIDSIKDLRGASRDTAFMSELDGQRAYFQALRCLNIAYSHALLGAYPEALALFARADQVILTASATVASLDPATPPALTVAESQLTALRERISLLVTRHRGLVALHAYHAEDTAKATANAAFAEPLVLHLDDYPAYVDLDNIVRYPPTLEPVPVKPIFLDLAWNYLRYPGEEEGARKGVMEEVGDVMQGVVDSVGGVVEGAEGEVAQEQQRQEQQQQGKKRGWFGFGRG